MPLTDGRALLAPRSLAEIAKLRDSEELAEVTLQKNDADNSGTLSIDEFYAMMKDTYRKTPGGARTLLQSYEDFCRGNPDKRKRRGRRE